MLGPLPRLHRVVLAVAALAIFVGLGAWLGALPFAPVLVSGGASLGILIGMGVAWLLVHEPNASRGRLPDRRR